MAAIAVFVNAPIDIDSARMCMEEARVYTHEQALSHDKKAQMREFVNACEDVIAGRALFMDAFPHGAESTFLWLAYGGNQPKTI